ncbi:MAG TPA: thermonuclease family protein [Bacilli bacterium]|nr:thermonuclease family protein [Bacilli bacterium]
MIFILLIPFCVKATTKKVTFASCIDGDTAKFIDQEQIIKVRFLAIDTPESTNEVEPYGQVASDYTCQRISKAKQITLEFDPNSDLKDKYDRYLAWVFVDENLLQKEIIQKGYGQVAYLYGDYKYTAELKVVQQTAQREKLGIWQETKSFNYRWLLLVVGLLIIIILGKNKLPFKLTKKNYKMIVKALKKI